jgi:hypothetical protein
MRRQLLIATYSADADNISASETITIEEKISAYSSTPVIFLILAGSTKKGRQENEKASGPGHQWAWGAVIGGHYF